MKKLKRLIIYLRLWFIRKMGYNLPSLREATCIVPGQLYDHFGRVVRAVPNELCIIIDTEDIGKEQKDVPDNCLQCDLYNKHIPCSFNHRMANGNDICENHHFEIICLNTGNI